MTKYTYKTLEPGIRVRIDPERKNGIRADQYYTLRFSVGGRQIAEGLGWASEGMNLPKARTALHKLKEAARTGEGPVTLAEQREQARRAREAERQRLTIGGLWDFYLEAHQERAGTPADKSRAKYLAGLFDSYPEDLRTGHVDALRRKIEAQGMSPQSVKHVLALLRRILRYCEGRGLCSLPGRALLNFDLPPVDNAKTENLTHEQARALLEALDADPDQNLAAMVRLALLTGMRRGALFGLQWGDLDFRNARITLRGATAKGGTTASIPMTDDARKVLLGVQRTESLYVFPGRNGGKRVECRRFLNRIRLRAGLPDGFRPLHGLRHTFASWLASSGVSLLQIKDLLTHRDYRSTTRYSDFFDHEQRLAASLIGEHLAQAVNAEPVTEPTGAKVVPFGGKRR